jgi:Protein of unknown function (DUF732)
VYEDEAMRMLAFVAGFAAVIGVAVPASADPGSSGAGPDASFLAALDSAGITYQSRTAAVAVGKEACQLMDQGDPEPDVVKEVSASNPNFTPTAATDFTVIAASAYCRGHLGKLTALQAPPPAPLPLIEFPIITPGAA